MILCEEGKYPVNYSNYEIPEKFEKCLTKDEEKIYPRLYFDEEKEQYRPCYETCNTCKKPGNKTHHNCITCESGYRLKPIGEPIHNCVINCTYYAFTSYEQYKCIEKLPCPDYSSLFIKEKNRCIDVCERDNIYKYQYNGYCHKECPDNLTSKNFKCYDNINLSYTLTEKESTLNYTEFLDSIETFVEQYSKEYTYTKSHVTKINNEEYDTIIYRKKEGIKDCINELSLEFPIIDFSACYDKVQKKYNITEDLIIVIINKYDENKNPINSYSFFDPNTGKKLETDICENDTILVKENILSLLKENISNYELMMALMEQGINIFNSSDEFYSDLCYDYKLETKKDIALQDRLKLFYPNISLCDSGCEQIAVDLENYTSQCECNFNDISKEKSKHSKIGKTEEVLVENLIGDVFDFFGSSNIGVGKCFSKISKSFKDSYGIYITSSLFLITTVCSAIFYALGLNQIKIFIYEITKNFLNYLGQGDMILEPPPKSHVRKEKNKPKTEITKKTRKNTYKKKTLKNKRLSRIDFKDKKIQNLNIMISINKNTNNANSRDSFQITSKVFRNNSLKKKTILNRKSTKNVEEQNISKNILNNKNYSACFEEFFADSPDDMEFDDAIRLDNRKFCGYFWDNLKAKQIISNTFCTKDAFKPRSIKIIIFILHILLYFVVNALFINDDYISQVYYLEKEDNFFSFIPRSINRFFYTTLVSIVIEFIVDFFFVEEGKLKRIYLREKGDKFKLQAEIIDLIKLIKYRYITFSIFLVILYGLCSYYLICFNSIYPKIQKEWVISSIFIFLIRQILSVLQCLLETILRFISFRTESEKLFKVSKLVN